jgi:hypothetical protein
MRRFAAPPDPYFASLTAAPGLGSDRNEDDLTEKVDANDGIPHWYDKDMSYSPAGKNRFRIPFEVIQVGHGMDTRPIHGGENLTDPGGNKQDTFGELDVPIDVGPYTSEDRHKTELGTDDFWNKDSTHFVRELQEVSSYQQSTRHMQPSFLESGPSPLSRWWRRYTYRKEYLQNAQTFAGERSVIEPGAVPRGAGGRMQVPLRSRLSDRNIPIAWGLNSEQYGG